VPKEKRLKKFSYGGCRVRSISPGRDQLPDVLNIVVGFDELLKLNLAVQQALLEMNQLNRNTTAGKNAAVNITVKTYQDFPRIDVVHA
jgi:hypothetical protein